MLANAALLLHSTQVVRTSRKWNPLLPEETFNAPEKASGDFVGVYNHVVAHGLWAIEGVVAETNTKEKS